MSKWFALTDGTVFLPQEEWSSFTLTADELRVMWESAIEGVKHCEPEEKTEIEEYVYFLSLDNETYVTDIYGNLLVSGGLVDGTSSFRK